MTQDFYDKIIAPNLFRGLEKNVITIVKKWVFCSKCGIISCPYFPVFGLNTEIYSVSGLLPEIKYLICEVTPWQT